MTAQVAPRTLSYMTQAISSFLAGDEEAQLSQPLGFAAPQVPALSAFESSPDTAIGAMPAPELFQPPAEPVRPLDQITPAADEPRDPEQPLAELLQAEQISDWDPHQPVPMSSASGLGDAGFEADQELSAEELKSLPAPTGAPAQIWQSSPQRRPDTGQLPTGQPPAFGSAPARPMDQPPRYPPAPPRYPAAPSNYPAGPYMAQGSPYPVNPYATGSYQNYQYYTDPAQKRRESRLSAMKGWMIFFYLLGILSGSFSPLWVISAGLIALRDDAPRRVMALLCAAFTVFVVFLTIIGFIPTDSLSAVARIISVPCLITLALTKVKQPSSYPQQ